jgi:hypothetical protein
MSLLKAAASGLVGACTLTLIHESARQFIPNAPRMDILGMRAIVKSLRLFNQEPPGGNRLHNITLAGDIVSNSAYYSLVGVGEPRRALLRGTLLGLAAGIGAVALPEPLGLGSAPSARTTETKAMTIGWYLAGGIAAALTYRLLSKQPHNSSNRRAR